MEYKGLIIYSLIYLVLFVVVEVMYVKLKLKTELTRKIVHISSGLIALSFPFVFEDFISIILLCSSFVLILFLSKRMNMLNSINNVERETRGSVLFPIIVCICFYALTQEKDYVFYYGPILVLAICDPIAAFAGKKFKFGPYTILGSTKTFAGNIGFFISCFSISFIVSYSTYANDVKPLITSLIISILCTVAEGVSVKGYDNITVPLTALGSLYFIRYIVLEQYGLH